MEEQTILVEEKGVDERLDKALCSLLDISRKRARDLLDGEAVRVNGVLEKASYKVKAGDQITVSGAPMEETEVKPEDIPLDIVYEDEDVLVINKPRGMVVHPAPGHYSGTLVNALTFHCKDLSGINGVMRPGIVHRIDKDTSGLLVVAKTPDAKTALGKQFFNKTTKREYNAVVWGVPDPREGRIEGNIGRSLRDRLQMAVFPDGDMGKHAVTHYEVLESFGHVSLVRCVLETGRTHQIRVHMRHIGHPLFNDARYGGDQVLRGVPSAKYKAFIENCFGICPRQALHARTLGFVHPRTGEEMFFTADIPADMTALIERWRNYAGHM